MPHDPRQPATTTGPARTIAGSTESSAGSGCPRRRTTRPLLAGTAGLAAATALCLALPTAPAARASSPDVWPLPTHPVPAGLTLIGASDQGVAVEQATVSDDPLTAPALFTGREGTQLERRPRIDPTPSSYPRTFLTVVGRTLAWYENVQRAGSQPKQAHRMDIRNGESLGEDGTIARPGAFTGDSWFSDSPIGFSDFPANWQHRCAATMPGRPARARRGRCARTSWCPMSATCPGSRWLRTGGRCCGRRFAAPRTSR